MIRRIQHVMDGMEHPQEEHECEIEIEQRDGIPGTVWDSCLSLITCLQQQPSPRFRGKRVLELGAGTGAAAIALACLGAHAVITDRPAAITLIQANIERNAKLIESQGGSATAQPLVWNEAVDEATASLYQQQFDFILCSDCIYEPAFFHAFVAELLRHCRSETTVVFIAQERRRRRELAFWQEFVQHFSVEPLKLERDAPTFCEDIVLCESHLLQHAATAAPRLPALEYFNESTFPDHLWQER